MEPEVHIIEKYFQEILHCFTMTNIKCKGNKEIDLLAINPKTQERFHVEVRIATRSKIKKEEGLFLYWKNVPRRIGLDYFQRYKFEDKRVKQKIAEMFGADTYQKILVVWDTQEGPNEFKIKDFAEQHYGIKLVTLRAMIFRFMKCRITSGSRDDILRTMELVRLMEERKVKIQKKLNKQRREKDIQNKDKS